VRHRLFAFASAVALAGPVAGQGLTEIERLALAGRAEEARELLSDWWEPGFAEARRVDRQAALWLRGVLTVDPAMAELDFQRLMVEYPGTFYAERALARLARAAEARGRTDEAADYFRRLIRGYPGSAQEEEARAWLDGHGLPVEAPEDAAAREPAAADSMLDSPVLETSQADSGPWSVQFGAFSSEDGALTLLKEIRDLGHNARMVRVSGSPLYRVRTGRFPNEEAAVREMDRLRRLGLDVTVVSNADMESQ